MGDVNYDGPLGKQDASSGNVPGRGAERTGSTFGPLKGTAGERDGIAARFGKTFPEGTITKLGRSPEAEATEEAIRNAAPNHRWLHLATHGFFTSSSVEPHPEDLLRPSLFAQQGIDAIHPGLLSGFVGRIRGLGLPVNLQPELTRLGSLALSGCRRRNRATSARSVRSCSVSARVATSRI